MSTLPINADEAYATYNTLPAVEIADQNFRQRLKDAGITLQEFLQKFVPLFSHGDERRRYSVWLLHSHFKLNPGEVMVEIDNTMAPMPINDTSLQIIGGRWNSAGFALEHRSRMRDPDLPPPPSANFMDQFRNIASSYNVADLVGVAYARMPMKSPDHVYLETTDDQNRTHISTQVLVDSLDSTHISTAWTPPVPVPVRSDTPETPVSRVMLVSTNEALCAFASHVCIGHTFDQLTTGTTATPTVTPRN